jgi:hypothetical protein
MELLETAAFTVLALAFCIRVPRAVKYREARLTCVGTALGAVAILTLGSIIPQAVLDAPLGGHNLLKLVQTSLALVAIWLGAQAAISVAPLAHRMNATSLAVIVALPAIPFLMIRRTEPTNAHFLDHNIRQFPAWLYATLYLGALMYVAMRLLFAFRGRNEIGAWLIKLGACAIIIASVDEETNFSLQLCTVGPRPLALILSDVFNLVF